MIGAAVEMKQTICNVAWWMLAESVDWIRKAEDEKLNRRLGCVGPKLGGGGRGRGALWLRVCVGVCGGA